MFLAWHEMKRSPLRFVLIIGVLALIAYLAFFLSGLATGLQTVNRAAIDKWDADAIVLREEADERLAASVIETNKQSAIKADEIAPLQQQTAIARYGKEKQNVALFGLDKNSFIAPEISKGKQIQGMYEAVASDELKKDGVNIGDKLKLSGTDVQLKVVGFTKNATYNVAPVLYIDHATFRLIQYGELTENNQSTINAFVIRTDEKLSTVTEDETLQVVAMEDFIKKLPGYSEQNMTLSIMIYFLLAISSFIVAIFLYVLTVQKTEVFGILKAQGISNRYLARTVVAQTFILTIIGLLIGFGLTLLSKQFLPESVPLTFDYSLMAIYAVIFLVIALLGSLFSVWTVSKIDPLKAIGG